MAMGCLICVVGGNSAESDVSDFVHYMGLRGFVPFRKYPITTYPKFHVKIHLPVGQVSMPNHIFELTEL